MAMVKKYPQHSRAWELLIEARCCSDPEYSPFADLEYFKACPDAVINVTGGAEDGAGLPLNISPLISSRCREIRKKQEINALFIINCNFGNENCAGLVAKHLHVPTLLWGPRDRNFSNNIRYTDTQCGLFAMSKQLKRNNVKFSYIENCDVEEKVFDEGMRRRLETGATRRIGIEGNFDKESIMGMAPDVIFISPFKRGGYDALRDVGVPLVPHLGYKETTPLGQAEWVKFVGMFVGLEREANELFAGVERRYRRLCSLVADSVGVRPVVFSGELRGGNWYAVGGRSFLAQLFRDAGADYFLAGDERSGGVTLDFETVYAQAEDADYWRIVNSYEGTFSYEALRAQDSRYADFRAFRERGIVYCNMRRTPFYERMPMQPDVVLADLIRVFHPGLLTGHKPVFYELLP